MSNPNAKTVILNNISERRSVRAFTDQPVADELIQELLHVARFAPSGVNHQPWQVAVLREQCLARVADAMVAAFESGANASPDYQYYPLEWFEPYKTRRFECGMALYNALDIEREDKAKRREMWKRNYRFFAAPVALMCLVDKRMQTGSWMDMGMFIQNILLAAQAFGLACCPQAAVAEYPDIIRQQLQLSDELAVVCGIAIGYPDWQHPTNQYRTAREAVDVFTRWYD